jgi:hypothetical protein
MGQRPGGKGPRDRINHLQVVVDADERTEIKRRAAASGLSVSAYLRAVALGRQISPVLDHQAVGELVKVAGDQGRLGGLLKLWLVNQPGRGAPEIEVRRLLDRLGDLQGTLADIVARV